MFRSGNYEAGEKFCKEANVSMTEEFKNQFRDLNLILHELKEKNVKTALNWAQDKANELEKIGSDLLFKLRKQEFLLLVEKAINVFIFKL